MMRDATDIGPMVINTIRRLAAEAVRKAKSLLPGTPMAAARTAYDLADAAKQVIAARLCHSKAAH
jgi:transketolase